MRKFLLFMAAFVAIHACTNPKTTNAADQSGGNPETAQSTGPDGADLLKALEGRWQSQQDTTYILEIVDTKMRHVNNGVLTEETDIEIDGSCLTTPCKLDSTDLIDGWCFMEKGKFGVQCNIIIECDKNCLKYNAVGSANPLLVFKKL